MRVLVDTNILLSHIVFRASGPGNTIADAMRIIERDGNVLLVSDYIRSEFSDVALRKGPWRSGALDAFLERYSGTYEFIADGPVEVELSISHDNDLPVLRATVRGRADCILTGDKRFLDAATRTGGIEVFDPAGFLARFS